MIAPCFMIILLIRSASALKATMFLFIFFYNAKMLIVSTVDKNNYVDNFSPMLFNATNNTTEPWPVNAVSM